MKVRKLKELLSRYLDDMEVVCVEDGFGSEISAHIEPNYMDVKDGAIYSDISSFASVPVVCLYTK